MGALGLGLGIGLRPSRGGASGPTYDTDAAAYFAAMSVQPDATRKGLLNDLIAGLKSDGVWSGLDWAYMHAAHDSQAGRLNMKAPGTFTATAVNTPTFTTDRGFAGDGATSDLNTGWKASVHGVNFTQNSASFGAYVNQSTNAASDAIMLMGSFTASPASGAFIYARGTSNVLRGRANSGSTANMTGGAGVTVRTGLSALDRATSTGQMGYRNGVLNGTNSPNASTVRNSSDFMILAGGIDNVAANFTTDRVAFAFAGRSFSEPEHLAIYNRVLTYLTAIGGN